MATIAEPAHVRAAHERQVAIYPAMAPPEYVVLRKLEYFREGRSTKHVADIRAIREVTGVDETILIPWLDRLGLAALWQELTSAD